MLISKKTTMEVFIQDKIPQALILFFFFINSFLLFKERLSLKSLLFKETLSLEVPYWKSLLFDGGGGLKSTYRPLLV